MMTATSESMLDLDNIAAEAVEGSENGSNGHQISSQPRFVCFQLGSGSYCVSADQVAEVSHPLSVTKLPGGTTLLMGIASMRGEIVAVVDLRTMLNEKPPAFSSKPKFVVVMSPDNGCQIALPVDGMRDMVSAQPSALLADKQVNPYVKSSISLESFTAGVVDIGEIGNAFTRGMA